MSNDKELTISQINGLRYVRNFPNQDLNTIMKRMDIGWNWKEFVQLASPDIALVGVSKNHDFHQRAYSVYYITDAGREALAAYEAQQQAANVPQNYVRVAKGAVVLTPMNGEPPVFMRIGTIDECQQWYDYQWRQVAIQHPDLTAYPSIGRPHSIDGFHRMVQFNNQNGDPMFLLHEYREQHWWYGRCVELLQDQQQQTAHLRAHEVHDPATVDALRQSLEQDVLWQQQMVRVTSSDVIGERKDPETLVIEYEFHITELEAKVAELQRERDEFAARYIAQKTMRETAEALLQEVREACASINYASEYNLVGYRDHQEIHVHTGSFITDGWTRCIYVNQDDLLTVKHLRAIASVAAKIDAALK